MGNGTTQFAYGPINVPQYFDERISVRYQVVSSILGLQSGESINIGYTAPISSLENILPEFRFFQVHANLYRAQRMSYLGTRSRCCITSEDVYVDSGKYITCNPAYKKPGYTRACDVDLANYCFGSPVNTGICKEWFRGYVADRGYDNYTNAAYQYCETAVQRSNNKFCEDFLDIMRENPDNQLHDQFIDRVRDQTFKCSYPKQQTLTRAKTTTLPRVCWDPNCITGSAWKLKYIDYITRLNCKVSTNSINFTLNEQQSLKSVSIQNTTYRTTGGDINDGENIYTKPLKNLGVGYLDIFSIKGLIIISLLIIFPVSLLQ